MSKITFRADDHLVEQLEAFDASKSEVMREALRAYLADGSSPELGADAAPAMEGSLDDLIAERVDAILAERLDQSLARRPPQDINVNITLDGDSAAVSPEEGDRRKTATPEHASASDGGRTTCKQCGETLSPSAVYCANCGEKASHRIFCECGDELRSDWSFCPGCGRRTAAADVLDSA